MCFSRVGRSIVFVVCAGALLVVAGCQPPLTEVSGTIKIKGKAPNVKGIEILFMCEDGKVVPAPVAEDGTYSGKDVRAGEAKVCLVYTDPKLVPTEKGVGGRMVKPPKDGGTPKPPTDGGESKNPIPLPLRDHGTSQMTTTLVAGQKNTFDYDIKLEMYQARIPK